MRCIVDVETNGLLPDATNMWCILVKPLETSLYYVFVPDEHQTSYDTTKLTLRDGETVEIRPLSGFKEFSTQITEWIGHNIINFDARAMLKLAYVNKIEIKTMTDTLILSQITQPSRTGGHSLKSWGVRFDDFKGEWKDFSEFSWPMVDYCLQDIRVTEKLYYHMQKNIAGFSKFSVRLEHAVRGILDEMEENGFFLDEERAHNLYVEIKAHCDKLEVEIQKEFPPEKVLIKDLVPRVTAKGDMHGQDRRTIDNNLHDVVVVDGVTHYMLYYWRSFNPRSTDQIVERMNQLGWEPVVYNHPTETALWHSALEFLGYSLDELKKSETPALAYFKDKERVVKLAEKKGWDASEIKGSPKVVEENFETLPSTAPKSAHTLAEWFLFDKRIQKLDEWFRELNSKTGCIHGRVFGCGAHTHRMTHRNPNMANISRVITKKDETGKDVLVWGKEGQYSTDMRACFIARDKKNRCLVGVDLSGVQLRALAHYADNQEYANQILNGDIHSYNRDILKVIINKFVEDNKVDREKVHFLTLNDKGMRNLSKTFVYGYLFGAGNKKVGSIFGFPEELQMEAGRYIKNEFASSIKGLDVFKKNIKKWARQGYMVGLDGRLITLPSEHIGLSVALQSFEAILMKYATVLAMRKIKERKIDAKLVAYVHDEVDFDVLKIHAKELGEIVVQSMNEAGEFFKTNIRIDGEWIEGDSWATCH